MKTLGEVLQLSAKFLSGKKIVNPRRIADELLSHVVKLPRIELYMKFDRPMDEAELELYRIYVRRATSGEPWQYIVGEVEFYHCKIAVSPQVLIPRQETEILVSKVLERLPRDPLMVWDVCCGSGYIGIALKKERPEWTVILSDISAGALEIARTNVMKNKVLVDLLQGDLLHPFQGKKADVIVCNPPYVAEGEFALLDREVRDFEPRQALVSGPTGLELYERLAEMLPSYLKPNSKIFFEIGAGMGKKVLNLFKAPCWVKKSLELDWANHDRFIFLEFQ